MLQKWEHGLENACCAALFQLSRKPGVVLGVVTCTCTRPTMRTIFTEVQSQHWSGVRAFQNGRSIASPVAIES